MIKKIGLEWDIYRDSSGDWCLSIEEEYGERLYSADFPTREGLIDELEGLVGRLKEEK